MAAWVRSRKLRDWRMLEMWFLTVPLLLMTSVSADLAVVGIVGDEAQEDEPLLS